MVLSNLLRPHPKDEITRVLNSVFYVNRLR